MIGTDSKKQIPTADFPILQNIPAELKETHQWVLWRFERKEDGEFTKIPIDPRTGKKASTSDPQTWSDFQTAASGVNEYKSDGMGFVFTKDDLYGGVDLDDCRNPETGEITPWALE